MSTEVKELIVTASENNKRIMFLAKEFLLGSEQIDIISGIPGAPIAARAAESLVRLNYVTYENITTDTSIDKGRRRTRFIIRLKKTSDFQKLYDENIANKNLKQSQNQESTSTQTPNK